MAEQNAKKKSQFKDTEQASEPDRVEMLKLSD